MISVETLPLPPPPRYFMFCAILSLVVHGGFFSLLGFMSKSATTPEVVPIVHVSLVPGASGKTWAAPAQPQPSLRSISRAMIPPSPSPTPTSRLSASRMRSLSSTLKSLPTQQPQVPSPPSASKRVLRDLYAAKALTARSLMKMSKSQLTPSPTFSPPQPTPSKLTHRKNRSAPSTLIDPSSTSEETQDSSSFTQQRKVLLARPPGGKGASNSKVGIIRSIKPIYPPVAKDSGWEGTVILRVLVQTNGLPGEVRVQKSSGHSILDAAATEAVRKWRFKPEQDGNIPIETYVDIPLKFDLQSS